MELCPVCRCPLQRDWHSEKPAENGRSGWFSGQYRCLNCGPLRISGTLRDNKYGMIHFRPSCSTDGLDPVIPIADRAWRCVQCGRVMELLGRKLVVTHDPKSYHLPPLSMATFRPKEDAICPDCQGDCTAGFDYDIECPTCHGSGFLETEAAR